MLMKVITKSLFEFCLANQSDPNCRNIDLTFSFVCFAVPASEPLLTDRR